MIIRICVKRRSKNFPRRSDDALRQQSIQNVKNVVALQTRRADLYIALSWRPLMETSGRIRENKITLRPDDSELLPRHSFKSLCFCNVPLINFRAVQSADLHDSLTYFKCRNHSLKISDHIRTSY